jgi:hypothetical protein
MLGLTYYTSDIDQFLKEFDQTHPKLSASQAEEVTKYNRIFERRDYAKQQLPKTPFWDKF